MAQSKQPYNEAFSSADFRALARRITLVENKLPGYKEILRELPVGPTPVIGITGPPGAGKSTLTNALIGHYVSLHKKVAVICIDPSSPFNLGALLGDRIRMSEWYTHPQVFIRSLASRGSLGGLHPGIVEITDVMKAAGFDYIVVETVGIGQSEIEIAGLADVTVVVVVPEAGDEIQTMKAGMMEIADIFVVNKADRPGADTFISNLRKMQTPGARVDIRDTTQNLPGLRSSSGKIKRTIVKAVATEKKGIDELASAIEAHLAESTASDIKFRLLAEKAYQLIREKRMEDISRQQLYGDIKAGNPANLYQFLQEHYGV